MKYNNWTKIFVFKKLRCFFKDEIYHFKCSKWEQN